MAVAMGRSLKSFTEQLEYEVHFLTSCRIYAYLCNNVCMFNFLKTENFNGKKQNRGIQMMKTTYEYCTYICDHFMISFDNNVLLNNLWMLFSIFCGSHWTLLHGYTKTNQVNGLIMNKNESSRYLFD